VNKLSTEGGALVDWVTSDVSGRAPVAVTVAGRRPGQAALAEHACSGCELGHPAAAAQNADYRSSTTPISSRVMQRELQRDQNAGYQVGLSNELLIEFTATYQPCC
jgi:hypothetical protein